MFGTPNEILPVWPTLSRSPILQLFGWGTPAHDAPAERAPTADVLADEHASAAELRDALRAPRDKYARLCGQVTQLIDELTPSAPDFQLRDACDQLVSAVRSFVYATCCGLCGSVG